MSVTGFWSKFLSGQIGLVGAHRDVAPSRSTRRTSDTSPTSAPCTKPAWRYIVPATNRTTLQPRRLSRH